MRFFALLTKPLALPAPLVIHLLSHPPPFLVSSLPSTHQHRNQHHLGKAMSGSSVKRRSHCCSRRSSSSSPSMNKSKKLPTVWLPLLFFCFHLHSFVQPVRSQASEDLKYKMEAHGVVKDVIPETPANVLEVSLSVLTQSPFALSSNQCNQSMFISFQPTGALRRQSESRTGQ